MEGVKSKYEEIKISDLSDLEKMIGMKEKFFECLLASEYLYNKTMKRKHILMYLEVLTQLEHNDFRGLHLALMGCIREWLYDTLDTDKTNLEDLKTEINKL